MSNLIYNGIDFSDCPGWWIHRYKELSMHLDKQKRSQYNYHYHYFHYHYPLIKNFKIADSNSIFIAKAIHNLKREANDNSNFLFSYIGPNWEYFNELYKLMFGQLEYAHFSSGRDFKDHIFEKCYDGNLMTFLHNPMSWDYEMMKPYDKRNVIFSIADL